MKTNNNNLPRVLHVCNMDGAGGASIGAYYLHNAMRNSGIDSRMLVVRKTTRDESVQQVRNYKRRIRKWERIFELAILRLQTSRNKLIRTLNIFPTGLHRQINNMDVDIVQLHWLGICTIGIGEIAKIKKPVVWKMPDMWPFSGSEHYTLPDHNKRYIEGYNRSNRDVDSHGIDVDKWVWRYKKYCWKNKEITIVGASRWTAECARKSALFKDYDVHVVNNPINREHFYPEKKQLVRNKIGVSNTKNIILFGAWHVEIDERKGFSKVLDALDDLKYRKRIDNITLVIFGTDKMPDFIGSRDLSGYVPPYDIVFLGELKDYRGLREAYSAADVYVTPAYLEGFGLTAAESLACGTPVACFDTSGLRDIVDHKINGYRAKCYDHKDLAEGIMWLLENKGDSIKQACVEKVTRAFDINNVVSKYTDIYQSVLNKRKKQSRN